MGGSWANVGEVELSLSQDVNNLHIFAIEKKARSKRRMFTLKYNIKSYRF
jgi:hypothetical protein